MYIENTYSTPANRLHVENYLYVYREYGAIDALGHGIQESPLCV